MSTAAPDRDLIDAAAADERLSARDGQALLDYYLTNRGLPNAAATLDLDVEVGSYVADGDVVGGQAYRFSFRRLRWSEVQDAQQNATIGLNLDGSPKHDTFALASWYCARALVSPRLAPTLAALRERDPRTAPTDAAALLRDMFEAESGTLIDMSEVVLAHSKLKGRATIRQASGATSAPPDAEIAAEPTKEMEAAGN